MEKSPTHLKVKLSPEADLALTGRHYYWNFIERTGADAETMSYKFMFDTETNVYENASENESGSTGQSASGNPSENTDNENTDTISINQQPGSANSSILGRYFGVSSILPQSGRMPEEIIIFGSKRLDQIFSSAHDKGRYVQIFEEPPVVTRGTPSSIPYSTWLNVNYKIEFICDMKREDIQSLGICMNTGEITAQFNERIKNRAFSSRIPTRTMLRESITLGRAVTALEAYIENYLKQFDYEWASDALERMKEELLRIDSYYGQEPEEELEQQYKRRKDEIQWQYKPRVEVSPINCGFYHLLTDTFQYH
jgi:hypothetical protein